MTKTPPMPLTKEEKDKILMEARAESDYDYILFSILVTTGRRIGELYGLQTKIRKKTPKFTGEKKVFYIEGKRMLVDKTITQYKPVNEWLYGVKVNDIDFKRGVMAVWVLKRRKYTQDETILLPEILELLRFYIKKEQLKDEDYVFRRKGRNYRNINNVLRKYARKAGLQTYKQVGEQKLNLSVHSFRHYFVTELLRKGWANERIAVLTGHKKLDTLRIYSHIVPEDIKDEYLEAARKI